MNKYFKPKPLKELLLRQAAEVRLGRRGCRKATTGKPKKEAGDSASASDADHLSTYMTTGLTWPPDWDAHPQLSAACSQHCQRIREVIFWHDQRPRNNEDVETIHDVNMSITWSNEGVDIVPTIVCSSVYWMRKARRQLWGPELLALQGVDFDKLDTTKYTHKNYTELAGNAFNGYAFLAFIIAAFSSVPFAELAEIRCAQSEDDLEAHSDESEAAMSNDDKEGVRVVTTSMRAAKRSRWVRWREDFQEPRYSLLLL